MFPVFFISFLFALSVHEAAHAWMAHRLGDPTAKLAGRVTLNPLVHLDPLGTLLPLFLMLTGAPFIIGWGKPVPVDSFNLRRPRRDTAYISLSGPLANFILAFLAAIIWRLLIHFFPLHNDAFTFFLLPLIQINIALAIFNLLPFYPLDGEKVLLGFLPSYLATKWEIFLRKYGFFFLFLLIFPFGGQQSLLDVLMRPLYYFFLRLLIPFANLI